jgi:hypothetical protein
MKSKSTGALLENIPLALLITLGCLLSFIAWWPLGIIYMLYTVIALPLFIAHVCPYCSSCYRDTCPSGYHLIAKRLFRSVRGKHFRNQFKRYTPLLYPIWFLPPVTTVVLLVSRFSWPVLTILVLFSFTGFCVIPLASKKLCGECTNARSCPQAVK